MQLRLLAYSTTIKKINSKIKITADKLNHQLWMYLMFCISPESSNEFLIEAYG